MASLFVADTSSQSVKISCRKREKGPKAKIKSEEVKPPEEPEYDPEVIANAHLTMEEDFYKCSVCKMKFKQPGNARRHIITVHRNEKPHNCVKCGAKFGRKVSFLFLCGLGCQIAHFYDTLYSNIFCSNKLVISKISTHLFIEIATIQNCTIFKSSFIKNNEYSHL